MSHLDSLRWRYAVKAFDPSKKLTEEQLDALLESLRLSASSYGLQPYHFIVIRNPALRAEIREHSWGQSQVTDASHLIALCARNSIDEAYVDRYVDLMARTRGISAESLRTYRDMMTGSIARQTPEGILEWNKRQTGIAFGFLLSAAAAMSIDSCPMEGYDTAKVEEILGLKDKGLSMVALCPVGFRSADDAAASYAKVRLPMEELVSTID